MRIVILFISMIQERIVRSEQNVFLSLQQGAVERAGEATFATIDSTWQFGEFLL